MKFVNSLLPVLMKKNPARQDGVTPLHMAAQEGHCEIFKLIFESLGNNNKNPGTDGGHTPLHTAARHGHLEICKIILDELDDKNPVAIDGLTPLYQAANHGHLEVFKFIFEKVKCCQHIHTTNTPSISKSCEF